MQEGQPIWLYIAENTSGWVAGACFFIWTLPVLLKVGGTVYYFPDFYAYLNRLRSAIKPVMWPVPVPLILADAYGLYSDAINQPWEKTSLWYVARLLALVAYWVWWRCRKHDDDDDFWKKKRRRAKEAIQRVGSRLVVGPAPNPT